METLNCLLLRAFPEPITCKRPQTRKFISWINIFFDDVKREIIETTETPNRDGEQQGVAPIPVFGQQRRSSHGAAEEKKKAFENYQFVGFEVAHEERIKD